MIREPLTFNAMEMGKVVIGDVLDAIVGKTFTLLPDGRTTICQITLRNGFTLYASSACVSIENYNQEIGEKIAWDNAVNKVWEVLGAVLAQEMAKKEAEGAVH